MKTQIINPFLVPALIAGLNLLPVGRVTAQTFTTLHSFTAVRTNSSVVYTNSDGANARTVILTGNTLYGTALYGGGSGNGTVFAVNCDGTGFTTLYSFTATPNGTNSDGSGPSAGVILSGNTLYGTAYQGGSSGSGTVFKLNTNGTGFMNLHSFTAPSTDLSGAYTNSDGTTPFVGLILSGDNLYGAAYGGGSSGNGALFTVNTDGTGFRVLHSFTTSDGSGPDGLISSGNTLYGTAQNGGGSGNGTVFAVNTNGSGFTTLHSFTELSVPYYGVNSDGALPYGLAVSDNTLYGTAVNGGDAGYGTVFAINTDGTGFTVLHSFTYSDGAYPHGVTLSGNTLFGAAEYGGGSGGYGTVFAVNTDGTAFTALYSFTALSGPYPSAGINGDGAFPVGWVVLSGSTLYGTAALGGSSGNGTVFSLSLPPPVARCKHVRVPADANCMANATIDDGSFDPTGGTITLVQSPAGPYPLGDTSVTLTVTDSHGASNSCVSTVTVADTAPPVITCPGNIVTDAMSPGGAVVSFAPEASDNCSLVRVTSSPASGSTFAIGDTTVPCTATDASGNQAACTFTVHVRGAAEQIPDLIALVQSLDLQSGTANSLSVKLKAAASALNRGDIEAACGSLGAFLNETNAQNGKELTSAQADLLMTEATRIRAVLGCR